MSASASASCRPAQVAAEEFLGEASPQTWLNRKLAKDAVGGADATAYLQSLSLALQLFLQETADHAEIALSSLFGKLTQLHCDSALAQRLTDDQHDAQTRVELLLRGHASTADAQNDDPLLLIKDAHHKLDLIRRALSRRNI